MKAFDTIVLGGGIAGLSYAIKAARRGSVALITKGALAETNTVRAQGGIACVMGGDDNFALHGADTIVAGAGICNEEVVEAVISEGPERIAELITYGVEFDKKDDTDYDLGREGGHSRRRILHTHDETGLAIERALIARARIDSNITVFENHMAVDFITTGKLGYAMQNSCVGVYVLDSATGRVETLRSDINVIATGGCGKVYLYTTNPDIATGDGVAMAWRAGAAVSNMEFVQFHPTCLHHNKVRSFLITEAVRGEGGRLINAKGEFFMDKAHPLAELAPRDIVARAIDAEMKRTGEKCVYLDITHKPADFVCERFPMIFEKCLSLGIDITREPIPVVPAAHYQCGGVRADINGETNLRGLYVIGEAACTGLHGANRLASNSLLEAVVFAHRLCEKAFHHPHPREHFDLPEWRPGQAADLDELVVVYHNWDEIRRLMWDYVGIVRTDKRLQRAAARLRNLHAEVQEFYWNFHVTRDLLELRNLVTVASLIVDCALSRKESRGLHFTLDYPQTDDRKWRKDTTMRRT